MINCIVVGLGGFVGAVLRYLISLINLNDSTVFPYKTLITNVLGALAIGFIVAFAVKKADLDPRLILFLKVGICGGFTTFSTFALESVNLFQAGRTWLSLLYIVLSVVLSILAVAFAQIVVK